MPMDRKRYPPDWKRIATEIKEAADWTCQRCGKKCRRPGEPFDTHKRTLTVAHLNHTPEDVRPENLQAMCAPCHLRYDAKHHAETRRNRKKIGAKEYADYGRCLMEGLKAGLQSEESGKNPETQEEKTELEVIE